MSTGLKLATDRDRADTAAFDPRDGQCFDALMLAPHRTPTGYTPGPQLRFVLLHPPEALLERCPTAAPIAIAYTPGSPHFNGTVRALWNRNASAESPGARDHVPHGDPDAVVPGAAGRARGQRMVPRVGS